jgi:L-ascorbate metabolism protein UlaG (beta-lactamase superfamily)
MPTLTRYAQSAFLIENAGRRYAFDFGSYVPADTVAGLGKVDGIFSSHIHPDHFELAHAKALGAAVYGPAEVHAAASEAGLTAHLVHSGDVVELDGITVRALTADHGPAVAAKPIENLGYVIEAGDKRIWFLGDMALPSPVPDGPIDLMMVPIGYRGYVFTPEQAAEYVKSTGHEGAVMPVHYDSSENDAGAAESFGDLSQDHFEVSVLGIGEPLAL